MTVTRRRFAVVLLAGALLAGACSDGGSEDASENPKQAFLDAIEAFSEYEGITMVMTIQADADDIASDDLPVETAEQLLDSSLTLSGKGNTPEDSQVEMIFNIGGNEDAVELRVVDQALYLRAEVRELVETFGGSSAEVDAAVQQGSAAGFDFVEPLADGEWVGLVGLDTLMEQFGATQPSADPEQNKALVEEITSAFEDTAEVTSEGPDDVGDHLLVRVPLKDFARGVFEAFEDLGSLPPGSLPPAEELDQIPDDAELPVDAWLDDGQLVQIELDFLQLAEDLAEESAPEGIDRIAMRMTFEEFTDDIEAPSDFVEINLQEILQGFFGAAPLTGTDSGGAELEVPADREVVLPELGLACSDLQTLSPEEIETFLEASGMPGAVNQIRQACPELF